MVGFNIVTHFKKIKIVSELREGCKNFHQEEARDAAYVISMHLINEKPNDLNRIVGAIKLILLTWNNSYFQGDRRVEKSNLDKDIFKAIDKCNSDLRRLNGKRLERIDLTNVDIKEMITNIFKKFKEKRSIGDTGASKSLHILMPELFMMWDRHIRSQYHRLHPYYRSYSTEDCYYEFLKNSQDIARSLLKQRTQNEIWFEHLNSINKDSRDFIESFIFKESLLKMIDEYNYIKITLPILRVKKQ